MFHKNKSIKISYYMRILNRKFSPFILSVFAVITATVIICVIAVSCRVNKLVFKSAFYFVCYRNEDNSVSAGSISGAVSNYGGAGYILEYGDSFYVTVACYYKENDAKSVCESLKNRDLNCEVLKIETDEYCVSKSSSEINALYAGNLNTLQSLSTLAYECANAIDTGTYGQNQAKSVILNVKSGLNGLLNANKDNCFSQHLRRLIAICDEVREDYVYSKDLRKLQIAIADVIINVKLY